MIVAEGAHDAELNPIRADYVKDVLSDRLGLDTRVTTLGHTQRGGRPCAYDRILVGMAQCVASKYWTEFSCLILHSLLYREWKPSMYFWKLHRRRLLT